MRYGRHVTSEKWRYEKIRECEFPRLSNKNTIKITKLNGSLNFVGFPEKLKPADIINYLILHEVPCKVES